MVFTLTNHEKQLWNAGMKPSLHLLFSTAELLPFLQHIETLVMRSTVQVNVYSSESLKYAMHPVIGALIDKRLLSHPDVDVNISVACCICAVIRTVVGYEPYNNEQMKDFFELVVITLEKLSSASRGCYSKMTRVLEQLSGGKFSVLMYDLQLDGLIVRLFTQFLTAADFNSEIVKLLVRCVRRENQVTISFHSSLNSQYQNTEMVNEFHNFVGETIPSKDTTRKRKLDCLEGSSNMVHHTRRSQDAIRLMGANKVNNSLGGTISTTSDRIHMLKLECQEGIRNTVQPVTNYQHGTRAAVNLQGIYSENERIHEKITHSLFDELRMRSKPVTEVNETEGTKLQSSSKLRKSTYAPILKAIFHNNMVTIAAECVCKTASVRSSLLKVVCKVVRRIQTSDVTTFLSEFKEIERQVLDAEATAHYVYHQEVVTFFDGRNKRHKLSYDNGDEALLHLEREQWELVSDCLEPAVAINVSSPQSGITCVQCYNVKNINAPILEAIFKKHGDIAADCVFKTASVRESILEVVCDVVRKIKTNDVKTIISEMDEIDSQVSENTSLVTRAAKIDLDQKRIELLSAQQRSEEADRCVKELHLVEQKLNDDILESKAEENKWVIQPIV
ncbi:phospholipase-like protein [Tanacetum coccineum]